MERWSREQIQRYLDTGLPGYEAVACLGSGSYGDVWRVVDGRGLMPGSRAVKAIPLEARGYARSGAEGAADKLTRDWRNLTQRLDKLTCPQLVTVHGMAQVDVTAEGRRAAAVGLVLMEYCPQNLFDFIQTEHEAGADPDRLRAVVHRMARVLKVLGDDKGFIFEDLKPDNVLVRSDDGEGPDVIAGDVGGLKALSSTSGQSNAQKTPLYTAPEDMTGEKLPDQRSMMWGFGLIAFEVLEGGPPYDQLEFSVARRNQRLMEEGPDWQAVTRKTFPDLVRVIERCLSRDPEARYENGAALMAALAAEAGRGQWSRKTAERPAEESRQPGSTGGNSRDTVGRGRPEPAGADGVAPTGHQAFETLQDAPFAPEMVVIPPGKFMMGSPDDDPEADDDEKPRHRVAIGYWLAVGKYAVTFAEFDQSVHETGYPHVPDDEGWARGLWPVINVSWEDARNYVAWLSARTGATYRLLTEAEWEYVARAGTETRYWWGDEITPDHANYGKNIGKTVPVGKYRPNPFGLYQVHGNVMEWVADCWHENYKGTPTDGGAWLQGDGGNCSRRLLRGGSWLNGPRDLRSADRDWVTAVSRGNIIGFRVARTL